MKILVLSDVHANLVALEAVLAGAPAVDATWNLGDTVGYGPRPVACLDLMATLRPAVTLAGNHDLAAIGQLDIDTFNPWARAAALWTRRQLDQQAQADLAALSSMVVAGDVTLAHASPREPVWEYIDSAAVARAVFAHFSTPVCLVGHTHVPLVAAQAAPGERVRLSPFRAGEVVDLTSGRWIINPGSVGQPRDGDPRAAYAILDTSRSTISSHRIPYDVARTQFQMAEAGLPAPLIARLAEGV